MYKFFGFLGLFILCIACESKKEVIVFLCHDKILLEIDKSMVVKQDTLRYEEGKIFQITTSNSSTILALCGGNAILKEPNNSTLLDSTYTNGVLSKSGIDNETGLYWKLHKNLMYLNVHKNEIPIHDKILKRGLGTT